MPAKAGQTEKFGVSFSLSHILHISFCVLVVGRVCALVMKNKCRKEVRG